MTSPDDNPYAPQAFPPPTGPAFSPSSGDTWVPEDGGAEVDNAVTQPVVGSVTEPVLAPPVSTNKHAKRSITLGALSLPLTPIVGIAAMVVGKRARGEIARTGERGIGLAWAGVWMGGVFSILWTLAAAFFIAVQVGSVAS